MSDSIADGSDGFFVRTCHRLSVQLRFADFLLNENSRKMIMNSAANDTVEVLLVEYNEVRFYNMAFMTGIEIS